VRLHPNGLSPCEERAGHDGAAWGTWPGDLSTYSLRALSRRGGEWSPSAKSRGTLVVVANPYGYAPGGKRRSAGPATTALAAVGRPPAVLRASRPRPRGPGPRSPGPATFGNRRAGQPLGRVPPSPVVGRSTTLYGLMTRKRRLVIPPVASSPIRSSSMSPAFKLSNRRIPLPIKTGAR
jgi:hypothetical protein